MVIATQNPIEMEGTYPLPEAQRDRFMARVSMGYPRRAAEIAMLDEHAAHDPLDDLTPVTDAADGAQADRDRSRTVYVAPRGPAATSSTSPPRPARTPDLRLGASPRATLHLLRAAKAAAALRRPRLRAARRRAAPAAVPVLAHRLLLSTDAQVSGRSAERVVADLVNVVPVPAGADSRG